MLTCVSHGLTQWRLETRTFWIQHQVPMKGNFWGHVSGASLSHPEGHSQRSKPWAQQAGSSCGGGIHTTLPFSLSLSFHSYQRTVTLPNRVLVGLRCDGAFDGHLTCFVLCRVHCEHPDQDCHHHCCFYFIQETEARLSVPRQLWDFCCKDHVQRGMT